eukprot:353272-Chlamydomonas_euryale.AAC.5
MTCCPSLAAYWRLPSGHACSALPSTPPPSMCLTTCSALQIMPVLRMHLPPCRACTSRAAPRHAVPHLLMPRHPVSHLLMP